MKYSKKDIEKIQEKYGLPCYIFDENAFCQNFESLQNTLKAEYNKYRVALSYKTNYTPKICKLAKSMGGYAEVVSDMEYEMARAYGYEPAQIIYNGPFKGPLMDEHVLHGGILNIDNLDEVNRVIDLATSRRRLLKVGLRVNIQVGQSFVSRFGIDADSEDLPEAFHRLDECSFTTVVGLHCHIGRTRGLEAWERRTRTLLRLADQYLHDTPEYLDLGSGMFGDMPVDIRAQFKVPVPSYADYAAVTSKLVCEHYKDVAEDKRPLLFTEPGTTVDNRYTDLIAQVTGIKQIRGNQLAVMNCSMHNLGDVANNVNLPITVVPNSNMQKEYDKLDMVGYTCLEQDVVYRGYHGKLGKDDYVVFGNVGGYSTVDKPPFILPQCAMIGIKDHESYLIKRKETTEDILSTYVMSD